MGNHHQLAAILSGSAIVSALVINYVAPAHALTGKQVNKNITGSKSPTSRWFVLGETHVEETSTRFHPLFEGWV